MDTLSLEVAGGFRIVVPRDPTSLSTFVFLEQEDWFEDEAPFLRHAFAPGDRVLDVGANLGFYALTAARIGGEAGRVWAFEPTPEIAGLLRDSAALNGFATLEVVEAALGRSPGTARLQRRGSAEGNRVAEGAAEGEAVALETLDGWWRGTPQARGIAFVKLDVEGHEEAVVAGGQAFFASESPLVMMEVSDDRDGAGAAIAALQALGYRQYRLLPEPAILVPHEGGPADPFMLNVFLARADRAAALEARGLLARAPGAAPLASPRAPEEFLLGLPALARQGERLRPLFAKLAPDGPVATALRAWLAARDATRPAAERAAALLLAVDAIARAVAERPSASRLLTQARIARGAGLRGTAYRATVEVTEALLRGQPLSLGEPFLPALPGYEAWMSPAGLQGWVAAMAIEARWRWNSHSLLLGTANFGGHDPVQLLRSLGRGSAFVERRAVLAGELAGRRPRPAARLLQRAPDNLNPDYWARYPAGAPDAR